MTGRRGDVLPHPDGDRLADEAVTRGQALACAIRDDGAWEVARITDPLSRDELVALAVALAAMVPLDRSAADLLAWLHDPLPSGQRFPDLRWSPEALRLAHAAWNRGERDPWSDEGERLYQQARHERRRAGRKSAVTPVENACGATGLLDSDAVGSNKAAPAGASTPDRSLTAPLDASERNGFVDSTISAPCDNTREAC